MKHLGGLAGTLLGILALTWAVQGDSFFLVGMWERAVSRAGLAISRPRGITPPSNIDAPTTVPEAGVAGPPVAQLAPAPQAPERGPNGRPSPALSAPAARAVESPAAPASAASPIEPRTDGLERIITVTRSGPIVEHPGRTGPPLMVVTEGTGVKLLGIEGEWFKVEFVDRKRGGPHVGYIHAQYVRANPRRQ